MVLYPIGQFLFLANIILILPINHVLIDKFFSSTILAFRMLCKENKSVNLLVSINYRFARDPTFQFRFVKKNIESNGVLFCRKGRRVKVQKSKGWRSFSRSTETRSPWFTGDLPPTPRIISRAKLIAKKFTKRYSKWPFKILNDN